MTDTTGGRAAAAATAGDPAAAAQGGRRAAWVRPRPDAAALRADAALAILLAFGALLTSLLYARSRIYEDPADPWLWALALGLISLPLALRRRYPVPVAVVVSIGFFVVGQFQVPELLMTNICLFIALYTVGAWESDRRLAFWTLFGIGALMMIWLIVSLILASTDEDILPGMPRSGLFSAYATYTTLQIITNLLYFGGAAFFGARSWTAARDHAQLEAQGRELELERRTSAAQAVALDRLEIARELHDVVAHHVSVMGIQAAAARRSLARDPQRAEQSLEIVEQSAHSAVDELRRLVHTLRAPEPEGAASTVGIAQLSTLVAESQSSGVPTTLIVAGEPRPVPLTVDVALYRAVQEALTNVRKHAGRGAAAEVRLRFEATAVEVEIGDNGVRQRLATGSGSEDALPGLGLRGMRERIGAVGGTLEAGRRERSGFMIRARVPLGARPEPVAVGGTTPSGVDA